MYLWQYLKMCSLCLLHFCSSLYNISKYYLTNKTFFLAKLSTKHKLFQFWSLNCEIFRKRKCKHIFSIFACPNELKNVQIMLVTKNSHGSIDMLQIRLHQFFKAVPEKGLAEKKSQARGGEKSKTRLSIVFFVNATGEKAIEPLVVWRSKKLRCFKNIKSLSRPHGYYFSNPKAWMTTEIMISILGKIN